MADYQEIVRADNTVYRADETEWPTADGGLLGLVADLVEPVGAVVRADAIGYTADNEIWPTADGGILTGTADLLDATVEAASAVGGGRYRYRPSPVVGVGFGILPELQGLAWGEVGVAGAGAATLPIAGEGFGVVDDFDDLDLLLMLAVAA
jgi:hypothetical protein